MGYRQATAATTPLPANAETTPRRHSSAIVGIEPSGNAYGGDLLADIVEYRDLRSRSLSPDIVTARDMSRLVRLEDRLRQPMDTDAEDRRYFRRFGCEFSAHLVRRHSDTIDVQDVTVHDVGAGGAKIEVDEELEPGTSVTLTFALRDQHGTRRRISMTSRVAWNSPGFAGIMFAGRPWLSGGRDEGRHG